MGIPLKVKFLYLGVFCNVDQYRSGTAAFGYIESLRKTLVIYVTSVTMVVPWYRDGVIIECFPEGFLYSKSGRPGPVLIDITKNAQIQKFNFQGYTHVTISVATGQNLLYVRNMYRKLPN